MLRMNLSPRVLANEEGRSAVILCIPDSKECVVVFTSNTLCWSQLVSRMDIAIDIARSWMEGFGV